MWKATFQKYHNRLIGLKVKFPRFRWVVRTLSMILSSAPILIPRIPLGVRRMLQQAKVMDI
jgi:hypothetical protein